MVAIAALHPARAQWTQPIRPSIGLFNWTHGFVNRLVIASDAVALLALAFAQPQLGAVASGTLDVLQSGLLGLLECAVYLVTLSYMRGYRVEQYRRTVTPLLLASIALLCSWACSALFLHAFAPGVMDGPTRFIQHHVPQLALIVVLRQLARLLMVEVDRRALIRRDVLVIGVGSEAQSVMDRLSEQSWRADFRVLGHVLPCSRSSDTATARNERRDPRHPVLGDLTTLDALLCETPIDTVVIALPPSRRGDLPAILEQLQWVSADVFLALEEVPSHAQFGPLSHLAGHPALHLMHKPLKGSKALMKLFEDKVIAGLALLLTSPVWIVAGIMIRLESPGPIFFRQERIGLNNVPFRIFKFRTMTVDPTDDGSRGTTNPFDKRITRVGRVLRMLSLDELPQILNVLRGDMSIVGPRPYVPNMLIEDQPFHLAVRSFAARHRIRPGITGLAQSRGLRSNALRNQPNAQASIQMDLDYIRTWSLWLDMEIMVRTLLFGMTGPEVF